MKSVIAVALLCALLPSVAFGYKWTSCGTRYDRLKTETLSFTASPGLEAGATATITTTGSTDLHVPFVTGAWQLRVYELGFAHDIYTTFGDLSTALKFTDPKVRSSAHGHVTAVTAPVTTACGFAVHSSTTRPTPSAALWLQNTTYEFSVTFTLPAAKGASSNFTASLISTDQAKATYNCLEIQYTYDSASVVEEPQALTVTDGPHFWSCGNSGDKVAVKRVTFSPSNPKAGDTVTITAEGTSSETISGGTLKYEGGLDGIPLIHGTKDLCSLLKKAGVACPVKAGPLDISYSVKLPGFVPAGNYSATGHAVDQNGNELLCMTGYFVLA